MIIGKDKDITLINSSLLLHRRLFLDFGNCEICFCLQHSSLLSLRHEEPETPTCTKKDIVNIKQSLLCLAICMYGRLPYFSEYSSNVANIIFSEIYLVIRDQ